MIGRLDGNLFTGLELQQVSLVQNGETIIAAKDVGLDYNVLDLVSGGIVIDAIRINEPTIAAAPRPERLEPRRPGEGAGAARPIAKARRGRLTSARLASRTAR